MLGEFTPVRQRGAVIAIYGAIYTLAGIVAPWVMGSVIQHAAVPLDGYMTGFTINAVVMVASGLLRAAAALAEHPSGLLSRAEIRVKWPATGPLHRRFGNSYKLRSI
jgi:MFS family permease